MASRTSLASAARVSGGVAAGTASTTPPTAEKPAWPDSATVGRSGSCGSRFADDIAIGTSLQARTWGRTLPAMMKAASTCPPITALVAGAPPENGTCVSFVPCTSLARWAVARWLVEPMPADE